MKSICMKIIVPMFAIEKVSSVFKEKIRIRARKLMYFLHKKSLRVQK